MVKAVTEMSYRESAVKVSKTNGKDYAYPVMGHVVGLDMKTRRNRSELNAMAGY